MGFLDEIKCFFFVQYTSPSWTPKTLNELYFTLLGEKMAEHYYKTSNLSAEAANPIN